MFRPAIKREAKLRLAIAGPSGSGKTYTALALATALAEEGRVAVVDTEHGSASKYADIFDFDVVNFDAPFHPDRFVEAIQTAESSGYDVIIIDSLSHAWNGTGGLLQIVDTAARKYKGNTYMAWSEGTPLQNRLVETIVGASIHVIGTMRSKQDYVLVERNGKQVPQKVGMAPIQRDGFEYEFDVFLEMDIENNAIVTKTRCPALVGVVIPEPGAELAETLQGWLNGEKPPTEEELRAMALDAPTLSDFTYAAYQLPDVATIFESEKRLTDWYSFVAGDYERAQTEQVLEILLDYCAAVAGGERVRDAVEEARDALEAMLAASEPA
ncbi:MAG: ATP-binding protein [Candidatus Promineifilaceae bacterium]|nr:ATP-binding protein [Candidatus Promineifilaceae bacterium]